MKQKRGQLKFNGICGLKNIRGGCFLNSTIQCVKVLPKLHEHLGGEDDVTSELKLLFELMMAPEVTSVTPTGLGAMRAQIKFQYGQYMQQQDAADALNFILTSINEAQTTTTSPRLSELFSGKVVTTIQCECTNESVSDQNFMTFPVRIQTGASRELGESLAQDDKSLGESSVNDDDDSCSLEESLRQEFAPKNLVALEWRCIGCQSSPGAVKKTQMLVPPKVLALHLLRGIDPDTKIDNLVMFPFTLDIGQHVRGEDVGSVIYHLTAVTNHYGSADSGHYTAFCRSSDGDVWYELDDTKVTVLPKDKVVTAGAYIIYYTRVNLCPSTWLMV